MHFPDPSWLVPGDNAWQLTAAMLIGLMSLPGIAILYGSPAKKKRAVPRAFDAFSAALVVWDGALTFVSQTTTKYKFGMPLRCKDSELDAGNAAIHGEEVEPLQLATRLGIMETLASEGVS